MRSSVKHALPLAALILAALGTASVAGGKPARPAPPVTGPAADYPMVIGDPFTIEGTTWIPADKLNSDEVGYASVSEGAAVGESAGSVVSGAHKTLPLPSYVEVTSLDTGKTILVRLERRGPMSNALLIELSPGAAAQLGVSGARAPVRVRRVNPPEQERAMLRGGGQAPARMDTPKGLLEVLRRKLAANEPLGSPAPKPALPGQPSPRPVATPTPKPLATPTPKPTAAPVAKPEPTPKPAPKPAVTGNFSVQVGAFSVEANARGVASKLGGRVVRPGKLWLAQMGPFATRAEAEAALAKARAAGYSDARILRAD